MLRTGTGFRVVGYRYTGTNRYRCVTGLKCNRNWINSAIEGELEKSIFKAGGIRDSNFGNFYKIGWARSSRTDKGVHSLATMISLKMEIPEDAWEDDPNGITLANCVNSSLPENIKVFAILSPRLDGSASSTNLKSHRRLAPDQKGKNQLAVRDFNLRQNVFFGSSNSDSRPSQVVLQLRLFFILQPTTAVISDLLRDLLIPQV
ncbi:putative tRNA pseudouridine synthase [Capsicum baccatum]|uniref:tRNA pseudouridine synthase n=1 Tax=Capsicum baccatum TaxID=33114 RepID=A0A2G2V5N1_CAPBA|nr:putative tRNA pseudouridine synthase [Capsicum baccatum]